MSAAGARGRPAVGASWSAERTTFCVWAPAATSVELVLEAPREAVYPLHRDGDGYWSGDLPRLDPGSLYRYRVDGRGPFPDPASRFQPRGVHGPSEVVAPHQFRWSDAGWRGVPLEELVLYEIHLGTFTTEGTLRAAAGRLPWLKDLGVTAIELMPLADFAGERNWGYDGVAPFAPARCYGTPDDLREFVDTAHRLGLGVHLDVVYNHLGPDGAYQGCFSPYYVSSAHRSPWGDTFNYDGAESGPVRAYVIENAVRWVTEYHMDGLRLDATHAIIDESLRPIVAELVAAVDAVAASLGRRALVIAEDARNLAAVVRSQASDDWGCDAVWSDDFHHQLRVALAGDRDGYFADFTGSTADIAATIRQGWYFTGQHSTFSGAPRGSDPTGIPIERFVCFLQNHDQTGNRAFGDRLHHAIDPAAWRAATALLLVLPQTPLLFMGQEWGATTPFRFFTDHHPELGLAVTRGRRDEFSRFRAFADAGTRETIPDPQALATFADSRLDWEEARREPHAGLLRLTSRLLRLRRSEPAFAPRARHAAAEATAWNDDVLLVRRESGKGAVVLAVVRLRGAGTVDLRGHPGARLAPGSAWVTLLTTEDPAFVTEPAALDLEADAPLLRFTRPGAVLLTAVPRTA